MTTQVPANWYKDPNGGEGLRRYWDGERWTDHYTRWDGSQWTQVNTPGSAGSSPSAEAEHGIVDDSPFAVPDDSPFAVGNATRQTHTQQREQRRPKRTALIVATAAAEEFNARSLGDLATTGGVQISDAIEVLENAAPRADIDPELLAQANGSNELVRFIGAHMREGNVAIDMGEYMSFWGYHSIADAAGLEAVTVVGPVVEGGLRAWNKVLVDDVWLALDVTWNDTPAGDRYLMIRDDQFTGSAERFEDDTWIFDGYRKSYATP